MSPQLNTESEPQVTPVKLGATIWLTGLPGSGKSTTAESLLRVLRDRRFSALGIDGDVLRRGVNADLNFSKEDRYESIRRAGQIALLGAQQGHVSVVSLVSPYERARTLVRECHRKAGVPFFLVWLSAPIEVCEARDPKHLYEKARNGAISSMTGVDDPYEEPIEPDFVLPTHQLTPNESSRCLEKNLYSLLGDIQRSNDHV